MSDTAQLFFEHFQPGQRHPGQTRLLDQAAFRAFAALTGDAHPIHYDATYARGRGLRAPLAHGLLVTAVGALGATALSARLEASMLAFLEQGMQFRAPVFEGDAVRTEFEVDTVRLASDRTRGVVRFIVRAFNQHEAPVAEGFHVYLIACQPQSTEEPR